MFFSLSSTIRIRLIARASALYPSSAKRRSSEWLARQRERENRALAGFARDANLPAMQFDEPARQREAQSRAFLLARVLAAHLAELLEHRLMIGGGDADAGVLDGDFDVVAGDPRANVDTPAIRRELDRVGQQIEQDLLQLPLV